MHIMSKVRVAPIESQHGEVTYELVGRGIGEQAERRIARGEWRIANGEGRLANMERVGWAKFMEVGYSRDAL